MCAIPCVLEELVCWGVGGGCKEGNNVYSGIRQSLLYSGNASCGIEDNEYISKGEKRPIGRPVHGNTFYGPNKVTPHLVKGLTVSEIHVDLPLHRNTVDTHA